MLTAEQLAIVYAWKSLTRNERGDNHDVYRAATLYIAQQGDGPMTDDQAHRAATREIFLRYRAPNWPVIEVFFDSPDLLRLHWLDAMLHEAAMEVATKGSDFEQEFFDSLWFVTNEPDAREYGVKNLFQAYKLSDPNTHVRAGHAYFTRRLAPPMQVAFVIAAVSDVDAIGQPPTDSSGRSRTVSFSRDRLAQYLELNPAAFRQRLHRIKERIEDLMCISRPSERDATS